MSKGMFEQANELQLQKKFAEAEDLYDQLLTQNHDNAGLLATLGTMYLQMQKPGLAMTLLHQAIERGRVQSDVLCNLGLAYRYSGQHEKALHFIKKATEVENPSAEALANYGGMFVEADQAGVALKALDRAIRIDPNLALAHWNRSLVLLAEGDWAEGWDEYEAGFKCGMRIDRDIGGLPLWDGSPGKRVVVYGEQGIGDEIMFASMLPDMLKTNEVVLECHTRLETLFKKSFPGVNCYGTREDPEPQWPANETADARISIGSLGKFFRRNKEDCPGTAYLKAEAAPKGEKFRVGISWTGGRRAGRVMKRTIPLGWWDSILSNDCEFISLQYTDCEAEIAKVEQEGGFTIKQFPEVKAHDYYETAKLVASCDLIISCTTSVIHLAGALGVPCWVMTPYAPDWRCQNKGRMPFYRSVRLYRQGTSKADSWIPVIQRIGLDLNDLLDQRKLKAA